MTHSIRGDKSICLPVASEEEYKTIIADNNLFRQHLIQVLEKSPEIFPIEMKKGFSFHDWVISSKQQLPMRRSYRVRSKTVVGTQTAHSRSETALELTKKSTSTSD